MGNITKVLLLLIVLFTISVFMNSFGSNFTGKVTDACTETDDGNDPYNYGFGTSVNDRGFEYRYADYCKEDKLIEYYCDDYSFDNVISHEYNCLYDCENGACKKSLN